MSSSIEFASALALKNYDLGHADVSIFFGKVEGRQGDNADDVYRCENPKFLRTQNWIWKILTRLDAIVGRKESR